MALLYLRGVRAAEVGATQRRRRHRAKPPAVRGACNRRAHKWPGSSTQVVRVPAAVHKSVVWRPVARTRGSEHNMGEPEPESVSCIKGDRELEES